mmetsp:Transcript_20037/g.62922  ORF Transcript_20037/g.62922 Transcript_20037/m.62922 type:complete len:221 (+) Transcript_20037:1017-1679(+)
MLSMGPRVTGQTAAIWSSSSRLSSPDLLTPNLACPQMSQRPFVPPKPKEDTPVRALFRWVSMPSVSKKQGNPATLRCGFSWRQCALGGHVPAMSMRMHLSRPAMPAPPSRWPMLDLELVRQRAKSRGSMALRRAPTSMGSPSAVPVPWHSARLIMRASSSASLIEAAMHACCEGPLGAVMLALRPSWLMQQPSMQAFCSRESSNLSLPLRNIRPTPSPRA